MTLTFIIFTAVICLLCLAFFGTRYQLIKINRTLSTTMAELEKIRQAETHLRQTTEQQENQLQQVMEDPVTSLLGWVLFEEKLKSSIKECERYQLTLGVLLVDIDNFKMINDALSYEIGDAMLKEVALRLKACARQVDTVSRITKDTFVILLSQLGKPETAALVCQRLLKALAEPFHINGQELYITACIGIALCPTDGNDAVTLLRSADHALHLAKEKGKHAYQFYQERLHVKSQQALSLYNSLNRESIFREFVLYYQPVINKQNGKVVCMDALLHWQHPEQGMISPAELFAVVDKQRKSNAITEWLLEHVCRQWLHWEASGFSPALIGVPISMKQLEHSHFIYRISQILQELKFDPTKLLFQLTDHSPSLSFDVLEKAFNMLNYLGIKIAIENFGTNYFPLQYLKSLKIDYVKLNNVFVDDVMNNDQAKSLLKCIVYLSETMSMQVIVKGVDSDDQVAALQSLGCLLMQGKHICDPLLENEVQAKMKAYQVQRT